MPSAMNYADSQLIEETTKALEAWLDDGPDEDTSQLLGTGAVQVAESLMAAWCEKDCAFMVPSATAGLLAVLRAAGVGVGDEVLLPNVDWSASAAVVSLLGAKPVVYNPKHSSLCGLVSGKTRCAIVSHVGCMEPQVIEERVCSALPPECLLVEDCSRILGWKAPEADYAVYSFGPGKQIDVGEAGMVTCKDRGLFERLISVTAHPLRQLMEGLEENPLTLSMRPHPFAAILLATELMQLTNSEGINPFDEGSDGRVYEIAGLMKSN